MTSYDIRNDFSYNICFSFIDKVDTSPYPPNQWGLNLLPFILEFNVILIEFTKCFVIMRT